jgi:hypothetical protein
MTLRLLVLALIAGGLPGWRVLQEVPEHVRPVLAKQLHEFVDLRREANWSAVYDRLSQVGLRHIGRPTREEYVTEKGRTRLHSVRLETVVLISGDWELSPLVVMEICIKEGGRWRAPTREAVIEASLEEEVWRFSDPIYATGLDGKPVPCELVASGG